MKADFGKLLTEAVKLIAAREDKTIEGVEISLGHLLGRNGGTCIQYWRKGNVPSEPSDIVTLAREIATRADVDKIWLSRFLEKANYSNTEELFDELTSVMLVRSTRFSNPTQLQGRTYRKLIGRGKLIQQLIALFEENEGISGITIDGVGGIGKTALAHEIADICWKQRIFEKVIWIKAANNKPALQKSVPNLLTFEKVIDEIAQALNLPHISQLSLSEKEVSIKRKLHEHKVLIVLDNLETAGDSQEYIVEKTLPLLGLSKVIITSRVRFEGALFSVHLTGLAGEPAKEYIHQQAHDKGLSRVYVTSESDLNSIIKVTGGSPLAIQLVVGQIGHLPIGEVLSLLEAVQPLDPESETDEYIGLYKFIYFPSWQLLSDGSKKLLLTVSHFEVGKGGTFEAIKTISKRETRDALRCIDELWKLSFLEIEDNLKDELTQIRYYLHALTQHFIRSDIVRISE